LYFRLNVFPIHVPPLRERQEDIPLLTWRFVRSWNERWIRRSNPSEKDHGTVAAPPLAGNVRELRNTIEQSLIVTSGSELNLQLPAPSEATPPLNVERNEHRHILTVLERTGWRIKGTGGAAELLGMKPSTYILRCSDWVFLTSTRRTVFRLRTACRPDRYLQPHTAQIFFNR